MSEGPQNPYSELMQELERRGEELVASASPHGVKRELVEKLVSLVAEGEQRFAELLATRQGALPSDVESLYRQKAELDRRLLGSGPARKRRWLEWLIVLSAIPALALIVYFGVASGRIWFRLW
jgi:hypothetical protein